MGLLTDMKIETWNVERLAHKKNLEQMLSECNAVKADILVLTETDERIKPRGLLWRYGKKYIGQREILMQEYIG